MTPFRPESGPRPPGDREAENEPGRPPADARPETAGDFPVRPAMRGELENHAVAAGIRLNPDAEIVDRVIAGLEARARKTGLRLCPCRLATGRPEEDRKIVCPCIYHLDEIARDGQCHCQLFVRR